MQHGGKKFEKIEKSKKKKRESWDSWSDGPQKIKDFKKRHHDRTTYRLLKSEQKEYE
jgi:hypothetical protein